MSSVVFPQHRGSLTRSGSTTRSGGLRDVFRRVASNARKDPYLLSSRRAEQIARILEGLVGMQLKLLLVPVMLLYLRKRRRQVTVDARRRTTGAHTTAMLVDYCLTHPFLAPLGKAVMSSIIERSRRQCYHPDDVLLCPREPARSAGIVICTTGKLLVKSGREGEGSMDRVMHNIRGGGSGGNAFYGDMIGLAPESETVMNAPVVLGAVRVLTDLANPHLVVAQTTVDAFLIPYDAIHAAVAGLADLDEVAPWRRTSSFSRKQQAKPEEPVSSIISAAVTPGLAQTSTLSPTSAKGSGRVSPVHYSPKHAPVSDPSHILVPRLLVLQTQFKMSTLFLRQSWFLHSTPEDMFHVVANKVECLTFAPGQLLVERGKPPPGVMFLRRGVAAITGRQPQSARAEERPDAYVMPGSVLGERSTAFNARSKESVTAVTFCDVWVLPKTDVERFRSDESVNAAWNTNAVSMATQWLQNIRNNERARLLRRREVEEAAKLLEDTGNGYSKRKLAVDPPSTAPLDGTPLALLPLSTQRIVVALRTVSYLSSAPIELLVELADAATPRVFLPQCAMTTMSEWSDALYALTMGTATVQHGLTSRSPPPNSSWVFRAGSCVGMECVAEHRTLFPICSVTMVEAWALPRSLVRERLAAHGLLLSAEQDAERVLHDLRLILAHSANPARPSSGKGNARQVISPSGGRLQSTLSPRRAVSPVQPAHVFSRLRSPLSPAPSHYGGHHDLDEKPILISNLPFAIDYDNGDINRGVVGVGSCLWFLSSVETARHGRYAKMFPEANDITGVDKKRQTDEDDQRHAERYRALAVEVLAMDLSGGDDSNRDVGNESFAAELARTFNEANERADEEQRLREAESAAQWGDARSVSQFSSDDSDDESLAIAGGTLHSARSLHTAHSSLQQQHIHPATYAVVESSETVGDRSPWLLQLLGRNGGIWGYLEGSHPDMGTMVVAAAATMGNRSGRQPSVAHLRALGSVMSLSARGKSLSSPTGAAVDGMLAGRPALLGASRRSRATSIISTAGNSIGSTHHRASSARHTRKSRADIMTVAAYKPENPHGYNVRMPDIIENPAHPTGTQREFLMASAVVGRMQRSSTVYFAFGQGGSTGDGGAFREHSQATSTGSSRFGKPPVGGRDLFDADVIAKVLQQSGGSSSDLVVQRNVSPNGNGGPTSIRVANRLRKGGGDVNQDDLIDVNYFDEDWEMMMSGQGVYNDGSPKILRLDVARKKRQQAAAAAAAAAAAKPPALPKDRSEPSPSSSRRLSNTLRESDGDAPVTPLPPTTARRATIVTQSGEPLMSTPFLDSVRTYLGRASVRLEVGTKRAVEELERPATPPSVPTSTPTLSEMQPYPPSQPTHGEARMLLVARRPQSGRPSHGSTTGTRCALLVPSLTSSAPPPAANAPPVRIPRSSARRRF